MVTQILNSKEQKTSFPSSKYHLSLVVDMSSEVKILIGSDDIALESRWDTGEPEVTL